MILAAAILYGFAAPSYRQGEPSLEGRKASEFDFQLAVAIPLLCSLCLLAVARTAPRAQSRPAPARGEQVGNVNFSMSCSPQVQGTLDQALALLHSFQYQEAEQVFTRSSQQDAGCAVAYWGKAMALYHQLWDFADAKTLAEGRRDVPSARQNTPVQLKSRSVPLNNGSVTDEDKRLLPSGPNLPSGGPE